MDFRMKHKVEETSKTGSDGARIQQQTRPAQQTSKPDNNKNKSKNAKKKERNKQQKRNPKHTKAAGTCSNTNSNKQSEVPPIIAKATQSSQQQQPLDATLSNSNKQSEAQHCPPNSRKHSMPPSRTILIGRNYTRTRNQTLRSNDELERRSMKSLS